jgi:hypothetical protein
MNTHTPGPWTAAIDEDNDCLVVSSETNSICTIDSYKECANDNAVLIAAAPHLLDACNEALEFIEARTKGLVIDVKDTLRIAIKKARNE